MGHPKKNVVHVSGYYEDQKENISTQRRRANKAGPSTVPSPDLVNKIDMESSDMEADFVVAQNSKLQESTVSKEVPIPSSQNHGTKEDFFS